MLIFSGDASEDVDDPCVVNVRTLSNHILWLKQELNNQVKFSPNSQVLSLTGLDNLLSTLEEYHHIFLL